MTSSIGPILEQVKKPELRQAEWTRNIKRSMLRQMIAVVSRPGILSFAGGLPAAGLFPRTDYAAAMAETLAAEPKSLQYGPPVPRLKSHIVDLMARRGVECSVEQIFITTGAQQALNVLSRLFLDQGGTVFLEELVYTGIQQVLGGCRANVVTATTDLRSGMDVDIFESHLQHGVTPDYLYTIPVAHNPLGVSLSAERAAKLLTLAQTYGFPIVEDDPYGFLTYDGETVPPLRSLDDEWIFYVGSFSKILAPALRLGWMVAPEQLLTKLTVLKEALDLETSALIQRTVAAYLDAGHLPAHIEMLQREYRIRRDTMLSSLAKHFPSSARWTRPAGGMFIWVELPEHVDTLSILEIAVEEEKVAYIPGSAFRIESSITGPAPADRSDNCLRLNFSNSSPEDIETGIERLGRILHRYC
jgi:2-aminoadipate transaminase